MNRAATSAVRNKAVDLALGVAADGTKDILGLWIETTEGAKFWLKVMNELKACGVEDILIAVVDGLKGFPEADRGGLSAGRGSNLHRTSGASWTLIVSFSKRLVRKNQTSRSRRPVIGFWLSAASRPTLQ